MPSIEGPLLWIEGAHILVQRARQNIIDALFEAAWPFKEPGCSLLIMDQKERCTEKFVRDLCCLLHVSATVQWAYRYPDFTPTVHITGGEDGAQKNLQAIFSSYVSSMSIVDCWGDDSPGL